MAIMINTMYQNYQQFHEPRSKKALYKDWKSLKETKSIALYGNITYAKIKIKQ